MKIAYTTYWDINDVKSWSGLVHFIARELKRQNFDVEFIDNLHSPKHDIYKIKSFVYQKILHKNYQRFREPQIIKDIAGKISDKLKTSNADIILSPGSLEVALLDTDKPIVIWTDATFAGLLDFYPEYTNLNNKTIENGHHLEQSSFDKSSLIIFSSEWAAKTALDNYDVKPEKIKVIPFGANINEETDETIIRRHIDKRLNGKVKLLFVGVRWQKKGGDIIYEACKTLKEKGVDVQLDIVGCRPEVNEALPDYVIAHGFLDKHNSDDWKQLKDLYLNSTFFVLPTQAEAYGLVFCEANAFGVPAIGTNLGGVPTIIKNDINGYLITPENAKDDIVNIILNHSQNPARYKSIALRSYYEYKTRLNWQVAVNKLKSFLQDML